MPTATYFSKNSGVQALYKFICKNETVDTEYWYQDHLGPSDMCRIYDRCFAHSDWRVLQDELSHWPSEHLEILTHGILNGYDRVQSYRYNQGLFDEDRYYIAERFQLILPLLRIAEMRGKHTNDVTETISEELCFINDHFAYLTTKLPNAIREILSICDHLGLHLLTEPQTGIAAELKTKIVNKGRS